MKRAAPNKNLVQLFSYFLSEPKNILSLSLKIDENKRFKKIRC